MPKCLGVHRENDPVKLNGPGHRLAQSAGEVLEQCQAVRPERKPRAGYTGQPASIQPAISATCAAVK